MQKRIQRLLKIAPLEVLITAIVFLLALFTFSLIVHEAVFEKEDAFDNSVIRYFSSHASPGFISLMEKITFFGSSSFLLPAYLVLIIWYIVKKNYPYAFDIAVIGITSTAMMFGLKQIFHRHRPELPIIKSISGYSFPSGHSLSSFIFSTILLYLVWNSTFSPLKKYILVVLLLLFPLLIGLSRVVLNVHYATDVIGGFCLAIAWVILSFFILKRIRRKTQPVVPEKAA